MNVVGEREKKHSLIKIKNEFKTRKSFRYYIKLQVIATELFSLFESHFFLRAIQK